MDNESRSPTSESSLLLAAAGVDHLGFDNVSRPKFAAAADHDLVVFPQSFNPLDAVPALQTCLDVPFTDPAIRIDNEHVGLIALALDRLNRNGKRIGLLVQYNPGFGVHPADQLTGRVFAIDFGMHGARLLAQGVGIARDLA